MRNAQKAFLAAVVCCGGWGEVRAAVVASDSFVTTVDGASNTYQYNASLNGQTATTGTTGYFTGAATGNSAPGWTLGTGAFTFQQTGLTHPLVVNQVTTNNGGVNAGGNANTRLQYRDFASTTPPASTDYYFSALMQESVNAYTGTSYTGLGPSLVTGQNGTVPTTGVDVGFLNGALALFYNNGGASLATQTLVATPTASSPYLVEIHTSGSGAAATVNAKVYNAAGTLVSSPAGVTATLNAADLGAFQFFDTLNFSAGSPSQIVYDELRFGTAESDVVVPEPASLSLAGLAALGLLGRRRRAR